MKLNRFILLLCLGVLARCSKPKCPTPTTPAGTTSSLVLQPDSATGKDATIFFITSQTTSKGTTNSTNYVYDRDLPAMEWTYQGSPGRKKSLIEFNLSSIPVTAIIISAKLSLFHSVGSADGGHNPLSGSNEGVIQRVLSSWDQTTVTWNNQPAVTDSNKVLIPASTSPTEDYLDIDVKLMVQDMVTNPGTNHGFLLSILNPVYYRQLIFASSNHPNAALHPKLVVEYK
jgi:hypothetical protein